MKEVNPPLKNNQASKLIWEGSYHRLDKLVEKLKTTLAKALPKTNASQERREEE